MPTVREIEIFKIAETTVNGNEVRRWMNHLGADPERVFSDAEQSSASNEALLIALAAKRCYMSFEAGLNPNVTQVRSDYVKYFDNILASGHGSVLEHASFSFAIEGVTRVFTAEMNRHRAGWAISEGSLRFIRFDKDIPFWMPLSLRAEEEDDKELRKKKEESRAIFLAAFRSQEMFYEQLIQLWDMDEKSKNFSYKKKVTSCLRRIVGMGVSTGGVWTGNVRALRHVLAMRCAPVAEEEISHVFTRVADMIIGEQPLLFGDFARPNGFYEPKYKKV